LYGTVRYLRSEKTTKKPCICCDGGPHIYGYNFEVEPNELLGTLPKHMQDAAGWLYRCTQQVPDGARLRVTVEVVPVDRCQYIDPEKGQCWFEDKPHPTHLFAGYEFPSREVPLNVPVPGDGHVYLTRRDGDGACISCGQPPHPAFAEEAKQ
jgi:hypothetical protein